MTAATNLHERFGLPSFEDHTFLIFGYGSILWKQNFDYVQSYPCFIKGYDRVFYQGSRDHRGTPDAPGRVVTLLPAADPAHTVVGVAFELPADSQELAAIFDKLDVREQGGYERDELPLYAFPAPAGGTEELLPVYKDGRKKKVVALCYVATESNGDYLGPAPVEDMAAHILRCSGPSGTNREYLFRLAECLRAMGAVDEHVFAIDAAAKRQVREREEEEEEKKELKKDDVKQFNINNNNYNYSNNTTATVLDQIHLLSVNTRSHKANLTQKCDGVRVRA